MKLNIKYKACIAVGVVASRSRSSPNPTNYYPNSLILSRLSDIVCHLFCFVLFIYLFFMPGSVRAFERNYRKANKTQNMKSAREPIFRYLFNLLKNAANKGAGQAVFHYCFPNWKVSCGCACVSFDPTAHADARGHPAASRFTYCIPKKPHPQPQPPHPGGGFSAAICLGVWPRF